MFNLKFPEITIPKPRLSTKVTVTITKVRLKKCLIGEWSAILVASIILVQWVAISLSPQGGLHARPSQVEAISEPSVKRILLNYFWTQVNEFQKNFSKFDITDFVHFVLYKYQIKLISEYSVEIWPILSPSKSLILSKIHLQSVIPSNLTDIGSI